MMIAAASRYPPQSSCASVTRRAQAPKHQGCDHCGGRFGLVTHRWWGNKFCKKVCKEAYVREIWLDRDAIRRWCKTTAGGEERRCYRHQVRDRLR
jgi:hypothetical protein